MHNAAGQRWCFENWHICLTHIPVRYQSKQKSPVRQTRKKLPMKRLFAILTIGIITVDCSREKTNENKLNDEQIVEKRKIFERYEPVRESILETKLTAEQRKLVTTYESLYNELLEFKETDEFKQFGFSQPGYSTWLQKVFKYMDKQKEHENLNKFSLEKEIHFGDLHMLGLDYVSSQGKETNQTYEGRKKIYRALNPLKISNEIPPSGKENYDKIRAEYNLFGKWVLNIRVIALNETQSYKYEIYNKENSYIGFAAQENWNYNAEILERKGIFFIIKGDNGSSRNGEHYRIDEDMNMVIFDQDGELTEHGFTATKDL
jgi:hypothetical protein